MFLCWRLFQCILLTLSQCLGSNSCKCAMRSSINLT
uniref:Uncharacterized protein n=1 Tax=Arundo donax TaxID=35708 RepID=A0A0A8YCP7_ARUDO